MAKKKPKTSEKSSPEQLPSFHRDIDRTVYQFRFLEAIRVHAGHILKELSGEIFHSYKSFPFERGISWSLSELMKHPSMWKVDDMGFRLEIPPAYLTPLVPRWWVLLENWAREKRLLLPRSRFLTVQPTSESGTHSLEQTIDENARSQNLWMLYQIYEGYDVVTKIDQKDAKPFPDLDDPDEIFGLMFIRVILNTLRSWNQHGIPDELQWVYPDGFPGNYFKEDGTILDRIKRALNKGILNPPSTSCSVEEFLRMMADKAPSYTIPVWDPTRESRSNFTKATVEEFKTVLNRFLDTEKKTAEELGITPIIQDNDDHYKRLVIYQLTDANQHQVAEAEESKRKKGETANFGATRTKVNQSLHATAERVVGPGYLLWLKERHRGRPKGNRSKR
jgi:hypothetical protein